MTYAIICNARRGHNRGISVLGLVDRAKTKRRWWTSDTPFLMIKYRDKDAAEFAAKRLRMNSARVVRFETAASLIQAQSDCAHDVVVDDSDLGWDAHRSGDER